jgi:predicted DNA-binding ribbon-helix-helix protein
MRNSGPAAARLRGYRGNRGRLTGHYSPVENRWWNAFWSGLKEIAARRVTTLSELVSEVDNQRQHTNLSSALRLFVLDFYRGQNSKMESDEQMPEMTVRPVS